MGGTPVGHTDEPPASPTAGADGRSRILPHRRSGSGAA